MSEPLRARSAFKLLDLNGKYKILRGNVVDLGAAPGGWSQVAARSGRVKNIVAVDLLPIDPMERVQTLRGDFLDWDVQNKVREMLRPVASQSPPDSDVSAVVGAASPSAAAQLEKRAPKADVVLSDMMAAMSGVKARDTQASLDLVEAASEFAHSVLKPGGAMV